MRYDPYQLGAKPHQLPYVHVSPTTSLGGGTSANVIRRCDPAWVRTRLQIHCRLELYSAHEGRTTQLSPELPPHEFKMIDTSSSFSCTSVSTFAQVGELDQVKRTPRSGECVLCTNKHTHNMDGFRKNPTMVRVSGELGM